MYVEILGAKKPDGRTTADGQRRADNQHDVQRFARSAATRAERERVMATTATRPYRGFKTRAAYNKYHREYKRDRWKRDPAWAEKQTNLIRSRVRAVSVRILQIKAEKGCVGCGERDPIVLDFDHRDPTVKEDAVSQMARRQRPWRFIAAEIEKCDVRCANCHRRRTAKQQSWYGIADEVHVGER